MTAPDSEPVVKITLKTIYDEVVATKELVAPLPGQVTDHESRIRKLEDFRSRAYGVGSTLVLGAGFIGAFISHLFK